MKKPKTTPKKPEPKAQVKQDVATEVTQAKPKKASPAQKPPKKAQTVASKPVVVTPEMAVSERVGLTAGSIWHYLAKNGVTPVSKLVKELSEEEKIIQRSIGWLAQESKIILDTNGRVETIALKD